MMLAISMLNNIFPLYIERKAIILSILVCYVKSHNISTFHIKMLIMLMNNIILKISGCDT